MTAGVGPRSTGRGDVSRTTVRMSAGSGTVTCCGRAGDLSAAGGEVPRVGRGASTGAGTTEGPGTEAARTGLVRTSATKPSSRLPAARGTCGTVKGRGIGDTAAISCGAVSTAGCGGRNSVRRSGLAPLSRNCCSISFTLCSKSELSRSDFA